MSLAGEDVSSAAPAGGPEELWRRVAVAVAGDRRRLRVARRAGGGFVEVRWPARGVPVVPYAVHVAGGGLVRTLAVDLDSARPRADVPADTAVVCQLLDAAGVRYVVAASSGRRSVRRHVLATFPAGVDPVEVRAVGRALRRWAPSVDLSPLSGSRTAAIRPPGSPHPRGGRSELLGDLAAAVGVLEAGNDSAGWRRLVDALGVTAADRAAAAGWGRVDGDLVDQAPVARRPLPAGWRRVWEQGLAAPLAVGRGWESRSQLLAGLAVVCAAHGWTGAEWAAACRDVRLAGGDRARRRHDPRCPHSRPGSVRSAGRSAGVDDGHVYVPRSPADTARVVGEAWDSALRLLTRARPAGPGRAGRPPAAEVLARVDAVAGRLATARWEGVDGLHDRQLLTGLLELAERAGTHTLGGSVRHLALEYGLTKSTVARSLHRLAAAGWLALALPHTGTQAAVWELLPPAEVTAGGDTAGIVAVAAGAADGVGPAQLGRGTLDLRPPGDGGRRLEQAVDLDAPSWRAGVQLRAHPLFDRSALGPGVGLVLSCISPAGTTLDQLAAATGLAPYAVASYLSTAVLAGLVDQVHQVQVDETQHGPARMTPIPADSAVDQAHGECRDEPGPGVSLAAGGRRWVRRPVDLDAIADRAGATEVRARRRRAYDADRLAWAWYVADYDRRRGWAVERAAHRGGRHTSPAAQQGTAQTELRLPLETRSFPRTGPDARSRACWAQARAAAADYLSGAGGSAAATAA